MGTTQYAHLQEDYNQLLFANAAAITSDTNSSTLDFSMAGGAPDFDVFIKQTGTGTGETCTYLLYQSSDNFVSDTADVLPLRLSGVNADGEYIIHLSNQLITKRYFRLRADVTITTGGTSMNILAYAKAKRP